MRVDIPKKVRLLDKNAEDRDSRIHTIEIGEDFITLFTKDSVAEWWNRGTPHNPKKYHCEVEHNLWIEHFFPGKLKEGWSQHMHLLIDNPQLSDFADYFSGMSAELEQELRDFYASA